MLLWGDPLKGDLEAVRVDVGVEQEVGEGGHGFVGVERECHVRTCCSKLVIALFTIR